MILHKKWLAMLAVITAILLLTACGNKESANEVPAQEGPQDMSPKDFMPLSDGLEEYPVWIQTDENPGRNTYVNGVYVFENGEVTGYTNFSDLNIEDIIDLSDDELIQTAKEIAGDVYIGEYTLDITLDRLGQNTEKIDVIMDNYTHIWTFDLDSLYWESGLSSMDEYIESLEKEGRDFEIDSEFITFTSTKDEPHSVLSSINGGMILQKIFDTTFSGLRRGDNESILTRVDDSFVGFIIDGSDTDKKNVTIEGK